MIFRESFEVEGHEVDDFDVMMVALRFNEKINQRDLDGLVELMTDDHTFVDNSGGVDRNMKEGWRHFFGDYPDYRNVFTSVTVAGNVVVMIGYSTCSNEPRLNGPSMWTAKVRDGLVSEWRVYWLHQR
jgi:ketosteroid isomerase-like protein